MSSFESPRWAVPVPPPGASRAERARHAVAERYSRHEMHWRWQEVCSGLDLTRRVVPTGTVSREPPRMGRVTLGPPTSFTVELRPGQLRQDIARWSDRLAAAFEVPEVHVDDLVRGWIVVELVECLALPDRTAPGPAPRAVPDPSPAPVVPPAPPREPRRRRRPFGRPRSWTRRPSPRHDG